jgi:hypothetical protein
METARMTREAFEGALDSGRLQIRLYSRGEDKWYSCRRNGRTQTWKKDTARFEIPIKYRFRDTTRVKSDHFYSGVIDNWFRIQQEDTNATT